jgi:hypothetical protein
LFLDENAKKLRDNGMKYILPIAAFFALSLTLSAQTDPSSSEAAPADPADAQIQQAQTEVMEAQDQKGEIKETITPSEGSVVETPTVPDPESINAKPKKAIVTQDLKGEIESIDVENRTFVVAGKTFKFWSTGKVFFKRKLKSLSDLKVGDRIAVTYRERSDGSLEASRINK